MVGVFLPTKTLPAVRAELIDAVREGCVSTGVSLFLPSCDETVHREPLCMQAEMQQAADEAAGSVAVKPEPKSSRGGVKKEKIAGESRLGFLSSSSLSKLL